MMFLLYKHYTTSIMENKLETIILRFRDLNTFDTIQVHKDIIDSSDFVWWGWWAKPQEKVPIEEFNYLYSLSDRASGLKIFLFDSGNEQLYEAVCKQIKFLNGQLMETPEEERTPSYYRENKYKLWFKITEISEPLTNAEEILHEYSYLCVDDFFVSEKSPFSLFYNKQVYSLAELSEQQRTIWFLKKREKTDKTYEIHSYNNDLLTSQNDSTYYQVLSSNEILWISDLHFSAKHHAFVEKAGDNNKLSIRLNREINKIGNVQPSFVIISGDLTYTAKTEEFEDAISFMKDLNSMYNLKRSHYAIVPGNHDISFSEEFDEKKPIMLAFDEAKASYVNFYKKYFGVEPEEKLYSVHRFLMNNLQPVEIICLNSCLLQQEKDHFQGMGFVGNDQMNEVENYLKVTRNARIFRILVLHHHLFPVLFKEEPKANRMYSMMLDSEAVNQFIGRNKINLVLHGHCHKDFYSEIIRKTSENKKFKYYVVGLGSTGVAENELSERSGNMFAILKFSNEKIIIEGHSLDPYGQESTPLFTHIIPVEEVI